MKILGLIEEDFVNYKVPCMTVMFPYCDFKCNKDCGQNVCQNMQLAYSDIIDISEKELVQRYVNNPISEALVLQGLEPFDSFKDLEDLLKEFSRFSSDQVVIYTGFYEEEIKDKVQKLKNVYNKIIVKFGRFIPNRDRRYDEILGVWLQSDNQYAKEV